MNSPTHKDMCEEFKKEISIKPSTSKRKRDYPKSTTKSKKDLDKHSIKPSASKLEAKVKTLDKPDKQIFKETLKTIRKKTSDKDKVKKLKPSLVDKPAKKEKKLEKDKIQYKKQQKIKPNKDLNDFDFLTKQIVPKATEKKPKTDDSDLVARKKLKRVRTISEEPPHNSNSEKCVRSLVKSIVRKTEKCQGNSPKRQRLKIDEGFDLRSKPSRANQRIHRKQMENDKSTNAKPQKNLKVSVENQNTVETKSPKKSNVLKYKTKKSRKLKLITNDVCKESDDESSSSDSNMNEAPPTQNMDLSFLDDFDVDEIVDSLKHSPKHNMKSPLQNENQLEDCTQMSAELQLKLVTILNMLQAKSETNKLKKTVKAEYNIKETTTSNSSIESSQAHPNSMSDHKTEEYVMNKIKKEENDFNDNKNAIHALIKILSQTESQLDQPKTAPPVDESLVAKCGSHSQVLDSNMSFINISQETMCSEDTDMLVIDESVIINERDISIIDLTNDTLLPASSEEHTDSIEAIQNFIQSQMQDINVDSQNAEKDANDNLPDLKPVDNNSELISKNTLGNNQDVLIDLTEDSLHDDIHEVMELNNGSTEKQVENELKLKQEIHSTPLPNVEEQIINNKSENDKITSTVIDEKSTKLVENISLTIIENDKSTNAKPQKNLKVSVENQNTVETQLPKKSNVLKYKTKKSRKLKFTINVVCEESDDESSSSDSNMNEAPPTQNMDLSFLDDFDVDEIVDSLKHSPKHNMKSPLQNENQLEDCTQMSAELQLKLVTILNMLQAKSETNKLKKTVKAEYNIKETTTSNSSIESSQAHPNSMSDHKTEEYVMNKIKKEENDFNDNKNAIHALIKILSQTESQLDQPKTAPPVDESLVAKCGSHSQVLDSNMSFINISQETMCSEDTDMLVIDESVIINERDISIIDLTNDTLLPASSEEHTDSIEAIQNFIQSQMQDINVDSQNAEKDANDNLPDLKPVDNNSELISKNTLGNNHDFLIDLTEESLHDDIHEVMELNNGSTEKQVENELKLKQEIHSTPLPNVEEQIKSDNDKSTVIDEKSTKLVENISLTIIDRLGDTSIKTKEPAANKSIIVSNNNDTEKMKNEKNNNNIENARENEKNLPESNAVDNKPAEKISVIANNNNDTVKVKIEANIINTDKEENVQNIPETVARSVKGNLDMNKAFETTTATKILKNIIDGVWDNNNELKNTANTDKTQNKVMKTANETKSELETVPNSNNVTVEKKAVPGKIISCQRNALTMLLEERMLNYLHKEIKVIQHIHRGKFSNIYSCKDFTTGEMYAAKILNNPNNPHTLGFQKEQMIRKLQQDIPRENASTVYLIDGFVIERYWCFLTEYYPKNLLQVFKNQTKPFHIHLVQDLTRQLISAVIVLRKNDIVHSDIKPSHILISTTHDRLKLCGFDNAYCGNNVYPRPNIGSTIYRAPEIILGFSASHSIDVWASALVIYQMATNQSLFTGHCNNCILYKQMCMFGSLPWDMVEASPFKNQHFQGIVFMKQFGHTGQDAIHSMPLHRFYKTKHLQRFLKNAYNKHWLTKDTLQRNSDMNKVTALTTLLEKMLLLDPRLRIAIEFVCADPFLN